MVAKNVTQKTPNRKKSSSEFSISFSFKIRYNKLDFWILLLRWFAFLFLGNC